MNPVTQNQEVQLELYHKLLRTTREIDGIDKSDLVTKSGRKYFSRLEVIAFLVSQLYKLNFSNNKEDPSPEMGRLNVEKFIKKLDKLKSNLPKATYELADQIFTLYSICVNQLKMKGESRYEQHSRYVKWFHQENSERLEQNKPSVYTLYSRSLVPKWYGTHLLSDCEVCQKV